MTRSGAAVLAASVLLAACAPEQTDEGSAGSVNARSNMYAGISESLPTGSPAIDSTGLIAAWDMATLTADGSLRDFGPHGLHGEILQAEVLDGVIGAARAFRTVADRVDLPESPAFDLDGPLTVATWVRVDSGGIHQHIAACDDKWALWITPADQFRLGDTHGGGWSSPEQTVRIGAWVPVVAVLRGTKGDPLEPAFVSLWVDGALAEAYAHLRNDEARSLGVWNSGDLFPDDACHLGFESHQGMESHKTLPFLGAIDEVLIFSRAWSDEEVQAFGRLIPRAIANRDRPDLPGSPGAP